MFQFIAKAEQLKIFDAADVGAWADAMERWWQKGADESLPIRADRAGRARARFARARMIEALVAVYEEGLAGR